MAFQYYFTDNDEKLHKTILSFEAFLSFDKTGDAKLARYWQYLLMKGNGKYQLRDYLDLDFMGITIPDLPYTKIGFFVYTYFGDSVNALRYHETYLQMCLYSNNVDNGEALVATYNNIATCYISQGNYQKALECNFSALRIL